MALQGRRPGAAYGRSKRDVADPARRCRDVDFTEHLAQVDLDILTDAPDWDAVGAAVEKVFAGFHATVAPAETPRPTESRASAQPTASYSSTGTVHSSRSI